MRLLRRRRRSRSQIVEVTRKQRLRVLESESPSPSQSQPLSGIGGDLRGQHFPVQFLDKDFQHYDVQNQAIFEEQTCYAMEFMGLPLKGVGNSERWGSGILVGVIDTHADKELDPSLLRCLHGSIRHKAIHDSCNNPTTTRLSDHGILCTNLIAAESENADFLGVCKGQIRGVVPSCDVITYAVGCRFCKFGSRILANALEEAISDKVSVISMSIGWKNLDRRPQTMLADFIGEMTLKAFENGILVCVPAGNKGPHLKSLGYGMPWSLNVGSCTSGKVGTTKIEVGVKSSSTTLEFPLIRSEEDVNIFAIIEGDSLNIFESDAFVPLFLTPKTRGRDCFLSVYYSKDVNERMATIARLELKEECKYPTNDFHPTRLTQAKVFGGDTQNLWDWNQKYGGLYVKMSTSKLSDDTRPPFVPKFSSRGPSALYEEIVMPNVVVPGAAIVAPWSEKLPLHEKRTFRPVSSKQCMKTGTSVSCALAAGGITYLMHRRLALGFDQLSPSALISAVMTTAKDLGKILADIEFSFGSGLINVEKAVTPGLLYEETSERFQLYRQGFLSVYDLNLASFAASFRHSHQRFERVFKRTVTNDDDIDDGDVIIYDSRIDYHKQYLDPRVEIEVQPSSLTFKHKRERKNFTLYCRVHPMYRGYLSGTLTWTARTGVRERQVISRIVLYEDSILDEPKGKMDNTLPQEGDQGSSQSKGKASSIIKSTDKRPMEDSPPIPDQGSSQSKGKASSIIKSTDKRPREDSPPIPEGKKARK